MKTTFHLLSVRGSRFGILLAAGLGAVALLLSPGAQAQASASFAEVDAIFAKHCFDCHTEPEPDGKFVMDTFDLLMKGGESGAVILPGKSSESLLVQMIEGRLEREGKTIVMPPGKRKKLETTEIAAIKRWIDDGAKGPEPGAVFVRELVVPKIEPKVPPKNPVKALAYAPSQKLIAVARYGEVELHSAESRLTVRKLTGHRGSVNSLVFSPDGGQMYAGSGEPALFGEIRVWNVSDGALVRTLIGHRDSVNALALSPDGQVLATGSYDQKIKLWKTASGEEWHTLSGHNGAVFDLSFRADGQILASASADRTAKLWHVQTGARRDTLAQSLKELHTVAFRPDGRRLAAGGVDNRIRVWEISESAAETTNPILESRFAHEGAILKLVYSTDGKQLLSAADDRTVKVWDGVEIKERVLLEKQPDWPAALTFALDDKTVVVGRLDGTVQFYETATGKIQEPPKPQLARAEPRGVQRGVETKLKLAGSNLWGLTELKFHHPKLSGRLLEADAKSSEAWIVLTAESSLKRGEYELSVASPHGESGRVKIHVDDLPQLSVQRSNRIETVPIPALPVSAWAAHRALGDTEEFHFEAKAGQTIVFDAAAKSLGSKSDLVLTLLDAQGKVLASNSSFDGGNDPFLVHAFASAGRYALRVQELVLAASDDHYYRLSVGELPFVTGCYPLSVRAQQETAVELIGHNLPPERTLTVKAGAPGEMDLPLDPEKFRSRRTFKLMVGSGLEILELEPNDETGEAQRIVVPAAIAGRIWKPAPSPAAASPASLPAPALDADLFRFEAKAGQRLIIETAAAQRGSPVDTKVEVLHADGRPVERLLLQAVRNSAVTFRGIDSSTSDCRVENWEEMELNQWLYLQGEVVKLFRAPQGPDSGFLFYSSNGRRRTYFDTSATVHALDEPCYIVEPHPPGTKLVSNGLPVFTLHFANDDDGERRLGTDSKLHFEAPADGAYLIRVTDTRGFQGERSVYRLAVREPKPDFEVTLSPANPTIPAGSGQAFTVSASRQDGFEGAITVEIQSLPAGFVITSPLVIQAGHHEAKGTLYALADAAPPSEGDCGLVTVTAKAHVEGTMVSKPVKNFGRIKLSEPPKLTVSLEPAAPGEKTLQTSGGAFKPCEITLAPGQTVPAWLRIKRNGHDELVTFTVDNLPHGVIVDNIGLNGVLIPKDQNEREIFLTAAKWVPETDRLCYAIENQAGRQTSLPVLLRVRSPGSALSASAR